MKARTIVLHPQTREKLKRLARRCRDADVRVRYLVVVRSSEGRSGKRIREALGCSTSTVTRTLGRYEALGEAGLVDRREDNGAREAGESYGAVVRWVLDGTPQEFFRRRPTWTKALLIETARRYAGGVTVSRTTTMGRVPKKLKARRGRPKPPAPCPWSEARKKQRMAMIHALVDALPPTEACVWEGEADIDRNPKIGSDRMWPATQRTVMTPGKNVKRHFAAAAAAADAASDRLTRVKADRKNSGLFIELLKELLESYPDKQVIHVVRDNYIIRASKQTRLWLEPFGQTFRPHFLPPYDPDDNRVERRVWREVHANVTINHRCETIERLCDEVVWDLMKHNRTAAQLQVRESRRAI